MPDIYDILKIKNEQGEWITVPALKGEKGDSGASTWGSITGNLADQTDLNEVLTTQSSQIATIRSVTDRFYTDSEGDLCEY